MDVPGEVPSVVPDVIDALVDAFTDLFKDNDDFPNVRVLDAVDDTNGRSDLLIIGAGDPEVEGFTEAADSTADRATTGLESEREETGYITCSFSAWGGSDKMRVPRRRAYAALGAVAAYLYRNWTLKADVDDPVSPGVDGLQEVEFGSTSRLIQGLDKYGNRVAIVLFRIQFTARI